MEKVGGMFKNEGMVEKGQAKRANAGNDEYGSGGGNNYGGSNNNNNNDY